MSESKELLRTNVNVLAAACRNFFEAEIAYNFAISHRKYGGFSREEKTETALTADVMYDFIINAHDAAVRILNEIFEAEITERNVCEEQVGRDILNRFLNTSSKAEAGAYLYLKWSYGKEADFEKAFFNEPTEDDFPNADVPLYYYNTSGITRSPKGYEELVERLERESFKRSYGVSVDELFEKGGDEKAAKDDTIIER